VSLPEIRWAVSCFEQILDRVVALLIIMRNLAEPTGQKRVNDRSEKNDGCNEVERFTLNPSW
jgi:sorbitol-specific phosphotransferase system component IIC